MKVDNLARTLVLSVVLMLALGIVQAAQAGQANTQVKATAQGGLVSGFYMDPVAINSNRGQTKVIFSVNSYTLVSIRVQDSSGKVVATILRATMEAPGTHVVTWYGKDSNGRSMPEGRYSAVLQAGLIPVETHVAPFVVDNTPPATTIRITGTKSRNGYYITPPTAYLTATDPGSGVKNTMYSLNGGPWAVYTTPLAIGDGDNTLLYRSTDAAGNAEQTRAQAIRCILSVPTVVSTSPASGSANVPVNTVIKATFNQQLIPSSVSSSTFIVRYGGTPIAGRINYYSNNRTIVFTPYAPLKASGMYTATVTTGVMNLAEVRMRSSYAWSFTTVKPSISGYAYLDSNRNMAYDRGEALLPGCRVMLMDTGTATTTYATTDGSGYYEFADLPDGLYFLMVAFTPIGYAPTTPTSSRISISSSQASVNFGFRAV